MVKNFRPRFNLRLLLFVSGVIAVACGSLAIYARPARQQQRAVANLGNAGIAVWYSEKYMERHGPNIVGWAPHNWQERCEEWAAAKLGIDFVYPVHRVHLYQPPSADTLASVRDLPWLQELHVGVGRGLEESAWQSLLGCGQIKKLTIERDPFEPPPLAGLSKLSNLQSLVIDQGDLSLQDAREIAQLQNLRELRLDLVGVDDEILNAFAELVRLETFELTHHGLSKSVTDQGVAFVEKLPRLCHLTLARLPLVTDRVFEPIENLPHLESLNLDQAGVRGTGLGRLKELNNLKELNLIGSRVNDHALAEVGGLSQLEVLDLYGTEITNAGLAHLAGLRDLKELSVGGTAITDAGMASIAELSQLGSLSLNQSKVTDKGVRQLIGLQVLRHINVDDTQITATQKKKLRAEMKQWSFR